MSCLPQWGDHSFFVEMKPRSDLASLFIDRPPNEDHENGELVRISGDRVSVQSADAEHRRGAIVENIQFKPDTMCSPSWADNNRLLMCRMQVEIANKNIVSKSYSRLFRDMCSCGDLSDMADYSKNSAAVLSCHCGARLIPQESKMVVESIPSDDWLSTSAGIDYYCRDSCGAGCDPHKHSHSKHTLYDDGNQQKKWLPDNKKMLISHSYVHLDSSSVGSAVDVEERKVNCSACHQNIGFVNRKDKNIVQFCHCSVRLSTVDQGFTFDRFPTVSHYLSLLILGACEAQSSQKIVVRGVDKTPHLLAWLLDSYVVMCGGVLDEENVQNGAGNPAAGDSPANGDVRHRANSVRVRPFPALKLLYKVFNAETAASDPRANGEDASVGVLEVPEGVAHLLLEALFKSSLSLPPACRSVGQFCVGYLHLFDSVI